MSPRPVLASRITKDRYLTRALRYHEELYGEARLIFESSVEPGYITLTKLVVPELEGEEREREKKIRGRLYNEAHRQEDQDYAELFRLLGRNVRSWWD